MKLRRSLAAAVATAAIIPAALMAAPAAFAETDGGTGTTETTDAGTDAGNTDEGADAGNTDEGADAGAADAGNTDEGADAGNTDEGADAGNTDEGADGGNTDEGADGGNGEDDGSIGGDEGNPPVETVCPETSDFTSKLSGLPASVVAGAGWEAFELTLTNNTGKDLDKVYPWVTAEAYKITGDGSSEDDFKYKGLIDLQYKNGAGVWKDVPEVSAEGGKFHGYIGYLSIADGASADVQMRLSVDADLNANLGYTLGIGEYWDDEANDVCYGTPVSDWIFEILKAGSDPKPGDAKPQGGSDPITSKPSGDLDELAATGSSSPIPGLVGTAAGAVLLGAAAVYVVRRRNGRTEVESVA